MFSGFLKNALLRVWLYVNILYVLFFISACTSVWEILCYLVTPVAAGDRRRREGRKDHTQEIGFGIGGRVPLSPFTFWIIEFIVHTLQHPAYKPTTQWTWSHSSYSVPMQKVNYTFVYWKRISSVTSSSDGRRCDSFYASFPRYEFSYWISLLFREFYAKSIVLSPRLQRFNISTLSFGSPDLLYLRLLSLRSVSLAP
jgi:hypothetical protein